MRLKGLFASDLWSGLWPAWLALVCSLSLTLVIWNDTLQTSERQTRLEFAAEVNQVRVDLIARIAGYAQTLRAAAALFSTADKVTREDWRAYVAGLKLDRGYPAIQTVAFARRVSNADLSALLSEVHDSGISDFAIRPVGQRQEYVVNVFTEPSTGSNIKALGYDMWQDADRRETMQRAGDAGEPMITRRTTLKIDESSSPVPAFIMYMPVVRKPDTGVYGYVLSPFRMPALMLDLLGNAGKRAVSLTIHDGLDPRPENLFYRSNQDDDASTAKYVHTEPFEIGGRTWSLTYASQPQLEARAGLRSSMPVLGSGLLASFLLFGMVTALASTRTRALRLARDMTSSLRESEENLSITLHSIGDAVIATDALGRVTRMNPVAERLTGWTLAQARDRPLAEVFCIINANTRAPVADPVQAVMLRGQVVDLANDTLLLARDQTECQIADSAAPIRNAAGEVVGVVLVFSDVTEKYQTEQALRESESRFREIFNSVSDAIFIHDAQTGRILDVNRSMCEMYGHTHAQALDCGPADLSFDKPPYSTAEAMETMQMARTKGPQSFDWLARARDGRPLWTSVSLKFAHIGSQERILAVVRDVSQRKEAEAKLQLAASVFSHAREGIIITDAIGTIIDVNEAFARITGYGRDEALGQNPRMLKSDRQDQTFYEAMWRDLIDQGHWSGEIWNRHKDDEVYAELLTISSVRDASGAVQQYVGLFSDISAMKEHQIQLEHIAHFDALTNLPNRVLLADRLQQAMAQAQRRRQQLAVVYLDLDGFKAINDQHGHDAGDQVLITLAQRMKHALREGDSLARLGGDEFVAVLIDLEDLAASRPLLSRLQEACSQSVRVGDLNLQVSASLGVTVFPQEQDIDADQLLRQADQAMYQAKLSGKNRFHFFDAEQDSSIRGRHESVERIRLALDNQEFVLYFQPKVNMRSGQIIGAEALIRWQHPEKGLLDPASFLPVIEEHPLAVSIGEWVIDKALTQMELWQAAGLDMKVSVNIGARQLQQGDFVDRLKFILAKHPQVNPASLELEVLETSALEDIAQVSDVIEACAHIGVKFALDDFGTGYSSLAYLKRLRVAMLKIDQSFVRDMLEDPDDLAILQGIIGLAESFKRQVIAEGVETVAHGSLLMQLGCELAQGYGIARPMPPDQLPGWAASWQPDAAWCELPWLGGLETES